MFTRTVVWSAVLAGAIGCTKETSAPDATDGGTSSDGSGVNVSEGGRTECSPQAGEIVSGTGIYPIGALPSGRSCVGSAACFLSVDPCASDTAFQSRDTYWCDCDAGAWACYDEYPAGSVAGSGSSGCLASDAGGSD
jgi:hypothetical protein